MQQEMESTIFRLRVRGFREMLFVGFRFQGWELQFMVQGLGKGAEDGNHDFKIQAFGPRKGKDHVWLRKRKGKWELQCHQGYRI